jgi:hypothetical protein
VDEPDSFTATVPDSEAMAEAGAGAAAGIGTASAGGTATGMRVCSLKKSLALRPGSALCVFACGRSQLVQLSEPNKAGTSRRAEIFKSLFISYLLSRIRQRKKEDRPVDCRSSPWLLS